MVYLLDEVAQLLRELDFELVPSEETGGVFVSPHWVYRLHLEGIYIDSTEEDDAWGYWIEVLSQLGHRIGDLAETDMESADDDIKDHLRFHGFPVDEVLRTKRLNALIGE